MEKNNPPDANSSANPLPLEGIRVLDVSTMAAGPIVSMSLGDLGADVLKVEHPKGDPVRRTGVTFPGGWSTFFLAVNRNKRFISIDYKSAEGRDLIRELARRSDVFVENARPGTWDKYGLGYESLKDVNPDLVYVSVSGFGRSGPMRDWIAMDPVAQAAGGIIGITGTPDQPATVGAAITDIVAGRLAAGGAVTALYARDRFGGGRHVETSLFDVAVSMLCMRDVEYHFTKKVPSRVGTAHGYVVPAQAFWTKDDKLFMLTIYSDDHFRKWCEVVGHPEVADDPRFVSGTTRHEHSAECVRIMQEVMRNKTQQEWTDVLAGLIPCGPVLEFDELWNHPQLEASGLMIEFEQPGAGKVRTVGSPVRFSRSGLEVRSLPGEIGRDTVEVLEELGLPLEQIRSWQSAGIIFPEPEERSPTDSRGIERGTS